MNVPEKINHFLSIRSQRAFCDNCIQERLGLKWRQQVQLVTATLAVTQSYTRAVGICCQCRQEKQVVRATRPAAGGFRTAMSNARPALRAVAS